MHHHRQRRFVRIPLAAEFRKVREAEVDVRQRLALDQPAYPYGIATVPDGSAAVAKLHEVEAEAEPCVHVDRPLREIVAGVVLGADAFVADELEPRRIVDEPQDERRVVENEPAEPKPLRAKDLDESAALAAKQRAEDTLRGATDKIEQAEAMKEIVRMTEQVKMIQRLRKGR